jgi:hypothetical protein
MSSDGSCPECHREHMFYVSGSTRYQVSCDCGCVYAYDTENHEKEILTPRQMYEKVKDGILDLEECDRNG